MFAAADTHASMTSVHCPCAHCCRLDGADGGGGGGYGSDEAEIVDDFGRSRIVRKGSSAHKVMAHHHRMLALIQWLQRLHDGSALLGRPANLRLCSTVQFWQAV